MRALPLPAFPRLSTGRRRLIATTAVAALLGGVPAGAQTPVLPVPVNDAVAEGIDTTGAAMTVRLDSLTQPRRIIEWQSFNIGTATDATPSVNFVDTALVKDRVAVLNRVVGGDSAPGLSQIYGSLSSDPNVSVFLVNPSGVLFGNSAAVNVGSLIVSTRDLANDDYFTRERLSTGAPTGYLTDTLEFRGTSAGAITVQSPSIKAGGIIALIAARVVTTDSAVVTAGRDAALVAANAVDVPFADPTSPLRVTIAEGTTLGEGLALRGTIAGKTVIVAAATRDDVTAGLLDVGATLTATSAYATDSGIVLAAGQTSRGNDRVTMLDGGGSEGVSGTAGVLGIRLGGTLTSEVGAVGGAAGGGIDILARNGVVEPAAVGGAVTRARLDADTSVAVLADREALQVGRIDAASLSLTAGAGSIAAGAVTVGNGATTIAATPGTITVGNAPRIYDGGIAVASLTAGGAVTASGGAIASAGGLGSTGGSVSLTATANPSLLASGIVALPSAYADGAASDLTITSASLRGVAAGDRATLRAGQALLATVTGAALLADATSRGATRLRAGGALSASGTVGSSEGAIDVRGGSVGLNVVDAATTLDAASIATTLALTEGRAGGAATLVAATDATLGRIEAATLGVTAGGAVRATELTATDAAATGDALSAAGSTLDIGVARAIVGSAGLTARTGAATVGALYAGTDALLTASNGRASLTAGGLIGRDLTVRGAEVRLGNATNAELSVGRDARFVATARDIAGSTPATGLTIRADTNATDATEGAILLDAVTGINLRGVTLVTGTGTTTGDVGVRLGSAAADLELDRVAARALVQTDPAAPIRGNVTLGQVDLIRGLALSTGGSITAASVAISDAGQALALTSTGGGVTVAGALSAAGGVAVRGRDAVSLGSVTATAGPVTLVSTTGTLRASGDVSARDDVLVDAPGAITMQAVRSAEGIVRFAPAGVATGVSAGAVRAFGDLVVSRDAGVDFASARSDAGAVSLAASGGTVTVGEIVAATAVTLGGANLALGSVEAGTTAALTAAGGIAATGSVEAGGTVTVDAPGAIRLVDLTTRNGDVRFGSTRLPVTDTIVANDVRAGGSILVDRAGGIGLGSAAARDGAVSLLSPGSAVSVAGATIAGTSVTVAGASATLGSVTAGSGFVSLAGDGGGVTAGAVSAGGSVSASAATAISLASAAAGGRVDLVTSSGRIDVAGAIVARDFVSVDAGAGARIGSVTGTGSGASLLRARGGTLAVAGATSVGGSLTVDGSAGVALVGVTSTGGAVTLVSAGGGVTAAAVDAATTVDAGGQGALSFTAVTARSGGVLLRSRGDAVTAQAVAARTTIDADAAATLAIGATSAGNGATLGGRAVTLGTVDAGTLVVTARGGDLGLEGGDVRGAATLTGTGAGTVAIGRLTATGPMRIASGGAVRVDRLEGGAAIVTASGDISGRAGALAANVASLSVNAGGGATIGAVVTTGDTDVTAGGAALLTGAIRAGGDLLARGASVTLGTAGAPVAQVAAGRVAMTSTGGAITGLAGLTLRSDSGGAGGRDLLLQSSGPIAFAAGTLLAGGPDRQSALRLAAGPGAGIALDAVEARTIASPGTAAALGYDGPLTIGRVAVRDTLAITLSGEVNPALTLGPVEVRAGDLSLDAPGALAIGAASVAGGRTTLAGATVAAGAITTRSLSANARGAATLGSIAATAGNVSIDAAGALAVGAVVAAAGDTTLAGATIAGDAITTRSLAATARTGAATFGAIEATGGVVATAAGDIRLPRATAAGGITLASSGGDVGGLTVPAVLASGGAVSVRADSTDGTRGAVLFDTVSGVGGIDLAGRTIVANALASSAGAVSASTRRDGAGIADQRITLGSIDAAGAVTLTTGNAGAPTSDGTIALDRARSSGASIAITTANGGLSARTAGARTALEAPAGAITVAAGGPVTLGTASAGGAIGLTSSGAASIGGAVTAGGTYRIDAASLSLGTAGATARQAGSEVALVARTGTIAAQGSTTLAAARGVSATANGANGAIAFAPETAITAGSGDVALATRGAAALGIVTASAGAIRLDATDAALTRPVTAQAVTLSNVASGGITRLGDAAGGNDTEFGASATRFDLTGAEIGLIAAPAVTIASGARDVVVGALSVSTGTGSTRFAITASGRVDMLGRFVASGSTAARTIAIGNATGSTGAPTGVIRVAATPGEGGRLLVDGATLELTAERIGVGYDRDFLDAIGYRSAGLSVEQVTRDYVARPTSTLYNAPALGAPPYTDLTLVRSGTLTLTYGRYALIQNTGRPGEQQGVTIGGNAGAGATLRLRTPGSTNNTFGFFGTIDGISSSAAALLGPDKLDVGQGVSPVASRINGCVIGSGAGCLNTSIAQPSLNLFDTSRAEIVRTADDLTLPFDPLIGTNNEALYLDPSADSDAATATDDCGDDKPCPPQP